MIALLLATPAGNDVAGIVTALLAALLILVWVGAIHAWWEILRR